MGTDFFCSIRIKEVRPKFASQGRRNDPRPPRSNIHRHHSVNPAVHVVGLSETDVSCRRPAGHIPRGSVQRGTVEIAQRYPEWRAHRGCRHLIFRSALEQSRLLSPHVAITKDALHRSIDTPMAMGPSGSDHRKSLINQAKSAFQGPKKPLWRLFGAENWLHGSDLAGQCPGRSDGCSRRMTCFCSHPPKEHGRTRFELESGDGVSKSVLFLATELVFTPQYRRLPYP